jgi:hypothetical protein
LISYDWLPNEPELAPPEDLSENEFFLDILFDLLKDEALLAAVAPTFLAPMPTAIN